MAHGAPLEGTVELPVSQDLSAEMVQGIDRFALRLIEHTKEYRKPTRDKLMAMLGMVDSRCAQTRDSCRFIRTSESVSRFMIPVFPGVHAEGLHFKGSPDRSRGNTIVCLTDAGESLDAAAAGMRLPADAEVFVLQLVNRETTYSINPRFGVRTNVAHREWLYRQTFVQGRTLIGIEVQKVLAICDFVSARSPDTSLTLIGEGDGGMVSMYAAALDERVKGVVLSGYFGPRETVWKEPLDRNLFGQLRNFGDAEVATLIAPRKVAVICGHYPVMAGPQNASAGVRAVAAPGLLAEVPESAVRAEATRALALIPGSWLSIHEGKRSCGEVAAELLGLRPEPVVDMMTHPLLDVQKSTVEELQRYVQTLFSADETLREREFWKGVPASPSQYSGFVAKERTRFWENFIGRLPDPDIPARPQSRLLRETAHVRIYEVRLDVWKDVFVWGWLAVPKDIVAGERRPVVVCQHGLEGLPENVFVEDPTTKAFASYQAYALRLAELGHITFAPHNPYRGGDAFRSLQRKLNPLGLTLFSVIIGQHQRILEWLGSLPFADAQKIAFYGLSYGGKSAMRIPAILPGYCLSICSGDFNEWVRKVASLEMPMSYVHTGEYEISEWALGRSFNYAEMAALIAPRPFMVERGHHDGVGTDEWVSYEYAKVRRLYAKLGISERTEIEFFDAGHTIHGVGTFEFLRKNLMQK